MKRVVLSLAAVAAIALSGLFTSTAQAHGPYGCRPGYGRYGYGYGAYTGYSPYNVYSSPFVPYGAGYSGGWQPYQGYYYRQPRIGLYFGY